MQTSTRLRNKHHTPTIQHTQSHIASSLTLTKEEEWKCLYGMKMDGCTLMIISSQCVDCPLSHVYAIDAEGLSGNLTN
ncbi:hypothetical protein EON63_14105 [archaeon]|nr:MAG: hypothetical protein EON63_14105 [archaeon]